MKENCKKQEHEAAMTALKAQKAAEEKAHAKTLEDSRREKMKFYTEVY